MNAEQLTGRRGGLFAGPLVHNTFFRQKAHRPQSRCGRRPNRYLFFLTYLNLTKLQAKIGKLGLEGFRGNVL